MIFFNLQTYLKKIDCFPVIISRFAAKQKRRQICIYRLSFRIASGEARAMTINQNTCAASRL
jgi:hypothetical protein